jgi:agmatinase
MTFEPSMLDEVMVSGAHVARDPLRRSFADIVQGRDSVGEADAVIFGAPFDLGTQHHLGTYLGPVGVRQAFSSFRPYSVELDLDFSEHLSVCDLGNIPVQDYKLYEPTFRLIGDLTEWIGKQGKVPILIGGDDSVSYPAISAFARQHQSIGLLWLDAHFDCSEGFRGDTAHCGTMLGNLIRRGEVDPDHVVHIGSRTYANYAETSRNARSLGFTIRTAEEVGERGPRGIIAEALETVTDGTDAFWLALDIDVLDAVYAPGTQAPRPGGLTSRELLTLVREAALAGAAGMDLVEVAPPKDVGNVTCMTAAACIMELIGALAARRVREPAAPGARA